MSQFPVMQHGTGQYRVNSEMSPGQGFRDVGHIAMRPVIRVIYFLL